MESSSRGHTRSPDVVGGSERKRRRKVLSCYDCRRRKLQCDRVMPACGRCRKAGQASGCLYIDDSIDMPKGRQPILEPSTVTGSNFQVANTGAIQSPPADVLARLEHQDRRIKELETALERAGQSPEHAIGPVQRLKTANTPLTPQSVIGISGMATTHGTAVADREPTGLRGKAFKTHFMGTTCTGGLIWHMPDFTTFTRDAYEKFPILAKIRQDMHALDDKASFATVRLDLPSTEQLRALLPGKDEVDYQVKLFLRTYGLIYHILHIPLFQQQYEEMWQKSDAGTAHFVATLLLILATVQCLTSDQWLYAARSSTYREKALSYISIVEEWLPSQSQKHVRAADFQIRFLLLLAKQVAARKYKRTWTEAGTNIRFCMSAGLHRNPDTLRKGTSALDKELRRRIWAATVELELQTSLDRGMIPQNWPLQADCSAPGNIKDDELMAENEQCPAEKPVEEFLASSYLALASKSVALRHMLTTTLNNIRHTLTFHDVKRYTEELNRHIENIPQWEDERSQIVHANLTLSLRQYLLILHDRHLRQAETTAEQNFSRMLLFDTSRNIVATHKKLISNGIYALEVLCNDQIRAALSVTRLATTLDPKCDSIISQVIEQDTSQIVNDVVDMLTDKVNRFGREQRQLWMALASHGFLKARRDPSRSLVYMQEAVDKIAQPYYKIMACQEDLPSAPGVTDLPVDRPGCHDSTGTRTQYDHQVSADIVTRPTELDVIDLPLLDIDELTAWTFEDWSFNPGDMNF